MSGILDLITFIALEVHTFLGTRYGKKNDFHVALLFCLILLGYMPSVSSMHIFIL
jgi:hypothetical protein